MTKRLRPCLGGLLIACLALAPAPAAAQARVGADQIQAGYRLLFNGDKAGAVTHFDGLTRASPDDLAARFGWLMAERERLSNVELRPNFEKVLDTYVDQADRRYSRNAKDADALFYLAQARFMRAEYRFSFDKGMFGAVRDAASAKGYIQTYVKQHPENDDGYLVLGMYNYYVDIAPTFVHLFRFLLFLPGGDRVEGLKQIERASSSGPLFAPVAKNMLMQIYSQFEGRGTDAVALGEQLQRQFPANDEVAFRIASIEAGPLMEDRASAAATYERIIDRRRNDHTPEGSGSYYSATLGLANLRRDEWRLDDAIALLTPVINANVTQPEWVMPQFLMRRANYRSVLNDPAAEEDAKRVLNDPKMATSKDNATNLIKQIEQRRASGEATTLAALIPGNRLTAEGRWDEALRAYEPVRASRPQDPFVRYRLAYLDFARGRVDAALPVFTSLVAAGKGVAEQLRAQSQLLIGRILDLTNQRAQALKAYQRVVDDFPQQGGPVNAAKVGLITPYHRPTPAKPAGA